MDLVLTTVGTKVLETLVDQFLQVIVDAKNKAVQYTDILNQMQKRVNSIAPLVKQIEELNTTLNRRNDEVEKLVDLLQSGQSLVKKCTEKVRWWNCCFKRPSYAGELLKLEEELNRYFQEIVQLQQRRDQMEMLVKINQIHAAFPGTGGYGGCAVPEAPKFVVGLEVHLMELKTRLLTSNGTRMIIVSASGGCGKTTLITKLCHDEEIKGHFGDRIYFVTLSRTLQVKRIVQRILQQTEQPVSEFQSDEDAVNQLGHRLRKVATKGMGCCFLSVPTLKKFKLNLKQQISPILLVLDDVWSGAEAFLENVQFEIEGYKILVASRSVFPRFGCTYPLTGLNHEDAMRLFHLAAGLRDAETNIPNEIVEKIVKGCKGLPLALMVVGRSLCSQPLAVWKKKEQEWSSGSSKLGTEEDIFNCLRMSLDVLKDKDPIKQCFLDLGCFPEDQRIPVTGLIDMWEELHGFDGDGVSAMDTIYKLCHRNLTSLTLVRGNANEVDNWHGGQFVTVHDLLRELAINLGSQKEDGLTERLIISIANGNFPNWWKDQKLHPTRARLLSITTDETFSSEWLNLEAPAAEVLILNFQSKNYTLPGFIEKLEKLKVLVATNYGYSPTELSNFHLIGSLSALRKIRLEHVSIPCLGKFPTQLNNLQRVSVVMCKIDAAFKNTNLCYVLPNLVEINIDYCDDLVELPEDICELSLLRRLSITGCHNLSSLPEAIGELANLEVLRLTSCTGLEMLPESIGSLRKLTVLDISDCLHMDKLPHQIGNLHSLQKLYMRKCLSLQGLPESMANLQQLKEVICDEERANLWRTFERTPKIKITKEDINLNWL
ncbi:probable disease resistance protein At5g66900 isoform X1 [Punica granatum]|uniref:Probable disease resistance protein At5g66900 isoform X1 n=1 Tax=Punica granatum TaxID=22663 RepID=A0A6P8CS59_PUNGR|nr:probable disease resistance protein At5g66900 isoform X1 [Punica granatum]